MKGIPEKIIAIKVEDARLCLNCETVIKENVCPMCGSKKQLRLSKILGVIR